MKELKNFKDFEQYNNEDLKTDISWFSGLNVEEEEAKSYIMFLLNRRWVKE